jgi:hypothetical protein
MVDMVSVRERETSERGRFLVRENTLWVCVNMKSTNPSLVWEMVYIHLQYTPSYGLWIRCTVGKDPSVFHGVTITILIYTKLRAMLSM